MKIHSIQFKNNNNDKCFIFYITYLKIGSKTLYYLNPSMLLIIDSIFINMFLRKLENHTFKDHLVIFIVENEHLTVS